MLEIKGKFETAICYTDEVEQTAMSQIYELCNQAPFAGSHIRIMPDVHAGKGCTIGLTCRVTDKIIPNIVGVDIGCGILTVELGQVEIDYNELDTVIRNKVPSGRNVFDEGGGHELPPDYFFRLYGRFGPQELDYFRSSIGTLGGGNHFIEIDQSEDGMKYLVIHSGSRNLGKRICETWQKKAIRNLKDMAQNDQFRSRSLRIIREYSKTDRHSEIQNALNELKKEFARGLPDDLCYLEGTDKEGYLLDMQFAQNYAVFNRLTIANAILFGMKLGDVSQHPSFETIHNYISPNDNIVRKGAVSAHKGERILIPLNMRDGSLICIGKGNEEWNCSAPHGAGRIMSRSQARENISMDEYREAMRGIWSSSVRESTIDESPMAYKDIDVVLDNIGPTADIIARIHPVYNFKA